MNLGFFVQTNGGTEQNEKIYTFLNNSIENKNLHNATVFFNDVAYNPIVPKFGMFNSANLWCFKGNLICTSVDNLKKAESVVNNIKVAYLFNSKQENVESNLFDFVGLSKRYKVITNSVEDQSRFFRLTGVNPELVESWSVEKLGEIFDE